MHIETLKFQLCSGSCIRLHKNTEMTKTASLTSQAVLVSGKMQIEGAVLGTWESDLLISLSS
jgi:hypothetical protein